MLRTQYDQTIRLVRQPDHAVAAGHMAAHWGNEEFTKLGYFGNCEDQKKLAEETIFGIAEHDNGWWEWEASPSNSESDKLPIGLSEVLSNPLESTMRWKIGISRFEETHPYGTLLTNLHAYRLYRAEINEEIHPLFVGSKSIGGKESPEVISLVETLKKQQDRIKQHLEKLGGWHKDAIKPEILQPHARLTQILDALSLYLCSSFIPPVSGKAKGLGRDEVELKHIPRKSWDDRINVHITPQEDGTLVCDPYPFDENNLVVPIIVTEIDVARHEEITLSELYKIPRKIIEFTFQRSK